MGLFKNLAGTLSNTFRIGNRSAGNKEIVANTLDVNKPVLRYNDTDDVWEVSHDGTTFQTIGDSDWRQDGSSVIYTPPVIDVLGPALNVTTSGGQAKLTIDPLADGMSANGIQVTKKVLAANWTGTDNTGYNDVDNGSGDALAVTFTCRENETVKVTTKATWREVDAGTVAIMRWRYTLDSVAEQDSAQAYHVASNNSATFAYLEHYFTGLSAGSHTVQLQAYGNNDIQIDSGGGEDAIITAVQFYGGYVKANNWPVQDATSRSGKTIDFVSQPGLGSELRVVMNDGSRYTATSPLSVDLDTTGLGGREASFSSLPTVWTSGTLTSLGTPDGSDHQTVTDASALFTANMVGQYLELRRTDIGNRNNLGMFEIVEYISTTQVKIYNPDGVAETAAILWGTGVVHLYAYAVPDVANPGLFDVIVSRRMPDEGPEDYAIWAPLGTITWWGVDSTIHPVAQRGAMFYWTDLSAPIADGNTSAGDYGSTEANPVNGWERIYRYKRNVNSKVTDLALFRGRVDSDENPGGNNRIHIGDGDPPSYTPSTGQGQDPFLFAMANGDFDTTYEQWLPMDTEQASIHFNSGASTDLTWSVGAVAFRDKYLAAFMANDLPSITNVGYADKVVVVSVGSSAGTTDSNFTVPAGTVITKVSTAVTTVYDGSATIEVKVNGGTPVIVQSTGENTPGTIGNYTTDAYDEISLDNVGKIRVTIGGTPTVGAAKIYVHYTKPLD